MKSFRIYVLRPVLILWALGLIWLQSEEIQTLRHDLQFWTETAVRYSGSCEIVGDEVKGKCMAGPCESIRATQKP